MPAKQRSHLNVVLPLIAAIVVMLALVAASPFLYREFAAPNGPGAAAPSVQPVPAPPLGNR
jgi:hypothetical protein